MLFRISLAFATLSDAEIGDFTHGVIEGMTNNTAYPEPPVTLANLQTAHTGFGVKVAEAKLGGPPDTAVKNNARQELLGMLRQLASYVQINCHNDLAILLSSGFQAASANRTQTPLEQPQALVIKNDTSQRLSASVKPVKNTSMYEGRIKGPADDWQPSVFTGDSQHITFGGLVPGTVYTIQVRALGGLTGQSDWSDPSSHMAT